MVEKFYNETGEVAVLISPGYGAGWSTWNSRYDDVLFDKRIVELVLSDMKGLITEELMAEFGYPDMYLGGVDQLVVEWLVPGTAFNINEYDGAESLITVNTLYHVA